MADRTAAQARSEKLFATAGWGERMHLARSRARLTLDDVGKALGITGGAVSRWEGEVSYPSRKNFAAFAELVGVDLALLQFAVGSRLSQGGRRVPMRNPWAPTHDLGITVECRFSCSASAFAIEAFGEKFLGTDAYQVGDIMVVDPEVKPEPGDYVLQTDASGTPSLDCYFPANSFSIMADQFIQTLRKKFGNRLPLEVSGAVHDILLEF